MLVALRRSPIDTGGLSRVAQVHDDSDFGGQHLEEGEGTVSGNLVVFRRSMIYFTHGIYVGITVDMASAMDERGTHSLSSEPCKAEWKDGGDTRGVESLV